MRLFLFLTIAILSCSGWAAEENSPEKVPEKSSENPVKSPAENAVEKSVFNIMEYRVEGNTVLGKCQIEEAVYPFLGETKSIDDVEKARAALEKTFHDAGYLTVFVNIPEQEVNQGIVRLQVLEGKVEKLRVVGSRYYSLGAIKDRVPEFAEGKVPHFPAVQQQLAAINTTADRQVAPVMRPGKTPGKVEVDLKVKDELPFHGGIELNNRYSANTTHTRLNGSLRYDNLWQLDHSLSLSFQVTPEDTNETKVFAATYVIPTRGGDYWAAYGVISKSDVAAVGDVNVIGNGDILGLRYIHPLPAVSNYSHSLTLGVDYKDFQESVVLQGADGFNTPISYMPFYAGYDGTLRTASSTTQLNLGLTFSLRGVGNNEQEFADKRYLAQSDFIYLKTDLKHTQQLPANWQLYGRLSGQLAGAPLISSEQFAIGGADTVRGYLESNSLGDQGWFGTLELRTPSLAKYLPGEAGEFYAEAFYDVGHVSIKEPLPAQTTQFDLASYGFGLQLKKWYGLSSTLDYAHALKTAGLVKEGDDRLHFRVGYDW